MKKLEHFSDEYDEKIITAMINLGIFTSNDLKKNVPFLRENFTAREVSAIIKYLQLKYGNIIEIKTKQTTLFNVYSIRVK